MTRNEFNNVYGGYIAWGKSNTNYRDENGNVIKDYRDKNGSHHTKHIGSIWF